MTDAELRAAYAEALAVRGAAARSECPTADALQALVDRAGPEAARLTTLDHVMRCPACHHEFELLRALRAAAPTPARPLGLRWLAAAAVVAAALTATLYFRVDGASNGPVLRDGGSTPVLIAPTGTVEAGDARVLRWRPATGATHYAVELMLGDSVLYAAAVRDTTVALPDSIVLERGRPYGWWVRARQADGSERASPFGTFTARSP
jgi:hypothetical protein